MSLDWLIRGCRFWEEVYIRQTVLVTIQSMKTSGRVRMQDGLSWDKGVSLTWRWLAAVQSGFWFCVCGDSNCGLKRIFGCAESAQPLTCGRFDFRGRSISASPPKILPNKPTLLWPHITPITPSSSSPTRNSPLNPQPCWSRIHCVWHALPLRYFAISIKFFNWIAFKWLSSSNTFKYFMWKFKEIIKNIFQNNSVYY